MPSLVKPVCLIQAYLKKNNYVASFINNLDAIKFFNPSIHNVILFDNLLFAKVAQKDLIKYIDSENKNLHLALPKVQYKFLQLCVDFYSLITLYRTLYKV